MAVDVDESGREDSAAEFDGPFRRGARQIRLDGEDFPVAGQYRGTAERRAASVGQPEIAEQRPHGFRIP